MAIKLLGVNGVKSEVVKKYIIDIEDEKDSVPTEDKVQGTEVYVIASGKVYRMNSNSEWIEKGV